jgi:hypothetical protein
MFWWIFGIIWMLVNVFILLWLYRVRCKHRWERVETKYPPAYPGSISYVRHCIQCGVERVM